MFDKPQFHIGKYLNDMEDINWIDALNKNTL